MRQYGALCRFCITAQRNRLFVSAGRTGRCIWRCPPLLSAVPLLFFHISISVRQEGHALVQQTHLLFPETWCKPPDVIDDPVAWIIAIEFRHA